MRRLLPRTVTCLALLLGAGPALAQSSPAALAVSQLLSRPGRLGLGAAESLAVARVTAGAQGVTSVSLQHTFQGHRVWNSGVLARVSPAGAVLQASTRGLSPSVNLDGAPVLTAAQASQAAARAVGPQVTVQGSPAAEQIVFSPRYIRETFVPVRKFPQPRAWIWAYQVHVNGRGPQGPVSTTYVIDGDTGVVLRADDRLVRAAAPVPAVGIGLGFYSGQVSVPATRMEDGTFALWDTTRGSLPNPALLYNQQNAGWGAGTVWQPAGLQVWFEAKDAAGADQYSQFLFQKDVLRGDFTNAWGDGLTWGGDWVNQGLANGQTAGVDILHAMAATWDFYGNVLSWNGIDGQGTSPYAMALQGGPQDTGNYQTDVASWDGYNFSLHLGAGSYPANPAGLLSLSDLEVVAHELAHGVTDATAAFDFYPPANLVEEPALNEGTADFLAQMAKAYATVGAGDDPFTVPDRGIDWTFGARVNRGTPLRWLYQPSKDGASFDAWHDGLAYVDPHYTGGVLARALYFLAQGASADLADDGHSRFLPQGMQGIGNDHATRIWWKVLTENFSGHAFSSLKFKDARSAALGAAIDLYGEGSPEAVAVENAFAAVNVGVPHGGIPHVVVAFEDWRPADDFFTLFYPPWFTSRQIFPAGETVPIKISVQNSHFAEVAWSTGGPSMFRGVSPTSGTEVGGTMNPDGTWTIPNLVGKYAITATSLADPAQFAEGRAICIHFDLDSDGENDAMDLAALGFEWLVPRYLDQNQMVYPALGAGDDDVALLVDAIKNAWPAK